LGADTPVEGWSLEGGDLSGVPALNKVLGHFSVPCHPPAPRKTYVPQHVLVQA